MAHRAPEDFGGHDVGGVLSSGLVLAGFVLLGVLVHWVPNVGVPLHSDTAWIFRLMAAPASDVGLARAIPEAFRVLGAYPHDPLHAFLEWYRQTERFNILDLTSLWMIARTSGGNAELWRLWSVVPLGLAIGFFYLTAVRLGIQRSLALLLGLALVVAPVEVWVRYNTAEPRGVFWLSVSCYLAIRSGRPIASVLSALAMLAAVLTKEPMLSGWVVVAALVYHRESMGPALSRAARVRRMAVQLAPHAAAFALLVAWVVFLKRFAVVVNSYTDPADLGTLRASAVFVYYYLSGTFPRSLLPIAVGPLLLLAWYAWTGRIAWSEARRELAESRTRVLIAALCVAMLVHAWVYYSTGRFVVDRYVIPGSFFATLLTGVMLAPILRAVRSGGSAREGMLVAAAGGALVGSAYRVGGEVWAGAALLMVAGVAAAAALAVYRVWAAGAGGTRAEWGRGALVATSVLFILGQLPALLHYAAQNRIDQAQWQGLVSRIVREAPRGAHVVLRFREPYMIETAQGLEATTLLAGRHDLSYSLAIEDTATYVERPALASIVRAQIASFNAGRRVSPGAPRVEVRADRDGGSSAGGEAPGVPVRSRDSHFSRGKRPYLNYQVEVRDSAAPAGRAGVSGVYPNYAGI